MRSASPRHASVAIVVLTICLCAPTKLWSRIQMRAAEIWLLHISSSEPRFNTLSYRSAARESERLDTSPCPDS